MKYRKFMCSSAAIALALPAVVSAQESSANSPPGGSSPDDEILVIADRLRGQVDTAQAPILELNAAEIAGYGASSIEDLLAAIEPQSGSTRGRGEGQPVFLINGIRVGSFREFRSYPPEAIQKVEILPEETAQKFGFPPDRRVINFILKDNYAATTAEFEYEQPDRGGYSYNEQELTLLKITKGGRLNLDIEANDRSMLTEAERGIVQTPGSVPAVSGDPDPAQYRSLVSDSANLQATANWAQAFLESGASLSLNGTYERSKNRSLSGLNTVVLTANGDSALRIFGADNPLERRSVADVFSSSIAYSRPVGNFQLTATADGNYSNSRTEIDKRADVSGLVADAASGALAINGIIPVVPYPGFEAANVKTYTLDNKITLRGSALYLPAGELSTTFDIGYKWNRIASEDSRAGSAIDLSRSNFLGGINIGVPITSTREDFLAAVGTITLNGQFAVNDVSDFGTLLRWTGGVTWEPVDGLNLQTTYVWREVQPSLTQLGSPQIKTLNVPTFDFATGDTALVEVTSGGNPDLKAETQSDWNFSANWDLPFLKGGSLRVDYVRNRSNDVSSSFPLLTPEIEAAFPGRVTRDTSGQLTKLDLRPIDFFESRTERLSFGLSLRGTLGGSARDGQGDASENRGSASAAGSTARPNAGTGEGRGPRGPVTDEQRERFAAFRQRVCAEDGEAFLFDVAERLARGDTIDDLPGFDPERMGRMLSRFRADDGSIDREKLSAFRAQICSSDGPPGRGGTGAGGRPGGDGATQPGAGGRPAGNRGGGIPGMAGGRDNATRYFLNLTHAIELNREILVAPGGPLLNLLDGDSLSALGNSRNTSTLEGGIFASGMGMRVSGRYTGPARINGGAAASSNLFVGDLATFDIRLFADLGSVFKQERGPLKGFRVSFKIDNVFDGRRKVTDGNGITPLAYQPFLLDPTGRYIGIDLRKMF